MPAPWPRLQSEVTSKNLTFTLAAAHPAIVRRTTRLSSSQSTNLGKGKKKLVYSCSTVSSGNMGSR